MSAVKRILMLNCEFPPIGGGAANATYHLLREFADFTDLRVDLVTSGASNETSCERFGPGIRIFKLNVKKRSLHFWRPGEIARWTWKAYCLARRLIRANSYHLCHCWFGWPSGIVGLLLRRHLPSLVALRGTDVPGYNERLQVLDRVVFNRISSAVWRRAAAVTANSENLRRLALKTCADRAIEVVYNGVDVNGPPPPRNGSTCTVLFVGRLIKRKGVRYLVQALSRFHDGAGRYRLIVAGDGPERGNLEQLCCDLGVESAVTFAGAVDREQLVRLYDRAHVLVLPSLEESLANAVLEAMAAGLPIITTDTGAAELLDGNGFVVEREDPGALAAAIRRYALNPALVGRHGARSYALARTLSWRRMAEAYHALYERIAGGVPVPVAVP
jgi:glycosyltransferase involved in cell wall biosynthesis